jgi:hypothetical protein
MNWDDNAFSAVVVLLLLGKVVVLMVVVGVVGVVIVMLMGMWNKGGNGVWKCLGVTGLLW